MSTSARVRDHVIHVNHVNHVGSRWLTLIHVIHVVHVNHVNHVGSRWLTLIHVNPCFFRYVARFRCTETTTETRHTPAHPRHRMQAWFEASLNMVRRSSPSVVVGNTSSASPEAPKDHTHLGSSSSLTGRCTPTSTTTKIYNFFRRFLQHQHEQRVLATADAAVAVLTTDWDTYLVSESVGPLSGWSSLLGSSGPLRDVPGTDSIDVDSRAWVPKSAVPFARMLLADSDEETLLVRREPKPAHSGFAFAPSSLLPPPPPPSHSLFTSHLFSP